MSYYDDGNLARKLVTPLPSAVPHVHPDEIEAKKRARRRQLQREASIRRQYKAAGRSHTKTIFRLLILFVLLAVSAGFVVWRSAKITEMSFVNAGLNRQIAELDKENGLLQDKISEKVSHQATREQAAEQLGMQKARTEQVHYVSSIFIQKEVDESRKRLAGRSGVMADSEWISVIETWVNDH